MPCYHDTPTVAATNNTTTTIIPIYHPFPPGRYLSIDITPHHTTTLQLLPEYMKDAGYTSHMVGKWHLGGHTFDHMPHRRGFETHLGYTYGRETYWTHEVN